MQFDAMVATRLLLTACALVAATTGLSTAGAVRINATRHASSGAIQESGIMPYELCSAKANAADAQIHKSSYVYNETEFSLAITAATVWNKTIPSVEFLSFNQDSKDICIEGGEVHRCSHATLHNFFPQFACRFNGKYKTVGVARTSFQPPSDRKSHTAIGMFELECALPWIDDVPISFQVSLEVAGRTVAYLNICHRPIHAPHEVVICTQPAFGYSPENKFWMGSTPYFNNHSLVDAFLLYHTKIMNSHVRFNDLTNETYGAVSSYLSSGMVSYRSNWLLPALNPAGHPTSKYDFETLAETTCLWEFRHKAHWFMIVHAVDNFVMPLDDEILSRQLRKTRRHHATLSGALVPVIESFSTDQTQESGHNVLERFPFLGEELPFGDARHTPLGNPRKISFGYVHHLVPRINEPLVMGSSDALHQLRLHTLHIMAIARPERNRQGRFDHLLSKRAAMLHRLVSLHMCCHRNEAGDVGASRTGAAWPTRPDRTLDPTLQTPST